MSLSIIIPVYNEEECIAECIKEVKNVFKDDDTEIIVVNDGSNDNSHKIISDIILKYPAIKYVRYKNNCGYSHAIREGFKNATKEYITFIDADLQYHPKELIKIYNFALINNHMFVIGEPRNKYYNLFRKILSKCYNIYVRIILGIDIKDANSLKLINKNLLKNIKLQMEYGMVELELLYSLKKQKIPITKFPILVRERFAGASKCSLKIILHTLFSIAKLRLKK